MSNSYRVDYLITMSNGRRVKRTVFSLTIANSKTEAEAKVIAARPHQSITITKTERTDK
jgi:hypothetical protein